MWDDNALDELDWVKEIAFGDLRFLNGHHLLAFIVYRWRGKPL
jgi:hypothetical protein